MKNWIRIILVFFVSIGSTAFFGYWSLGQFNRVFDNLSASYASNVFFISKSPKVEVGMPLATSSKISSEIATSTDLELSFIFPKKGSELYSGCTYQVSWQSSTTTSAITATTTATTAATTTFATINFLDMILINASTSEEFASTTSGMAKENIIEEDSQRVAWKVGTILPGKYNILVSKINEIDKEVKSETFIISKMLKGLDTEGKKKLCKKSNGSL